MIWRCSGIPSDLTIVPSTRDQANALIAQHHRHHGRVPGHRFAIGIERAGEVVGAAIVSRPVARELDRDRFTAEVVRLVVAPGVPNACSMLYRAAWRAWHEMGGRRLVTYTLPEEGGASLRGAGARFVGETGGGLLEPPDEATHRPRAPRPQAPMGMDRSGRCVN
jgi:hypothetical protein